jgi:DNA-binding MarR family transcriptional regulator
MVHQLISELDSGSKNVMTQKRIITYYMHNHSSTIPDLAKEIDLSIPTVTKFITEMCRLPGQLRKAGEYRRKTA